MWISRRSQCRHCRRIRGRRPRGLCWKCYFTPTIRRRYPTRRNQFCDLPRVGDVNRNAPLPTVTSRALPGSAEQLDILERRAAQGLSLFGPRDGPDLR